MVSGELTPIMRPENPAFRKASANDPPISPTPKIATVFMPDPTNLPDPSNWPDSTNWKNSGADPLVRSRRPRRLAAGPGGPARTWGTAPQFRECLVALASSNSPIHSLGNNPQLLHQLRELL